MSQLKLDLSYNFDGIKARSKTIRGVVNSAKNNVDHPIEYADPLSGDLFNVAYQTQPRIIRTKQQNDYNDILRAVAASDGFKNIRKETVGNLVWSSIGAAVMLDELSKTQDKSPNGDYPGDGDGDQEDNGNGSGDKQKDQQIAQAMAKAQERLEDLQEGLGGKRAGRGNSLPTFADSAIETEQLAGLLANRKFASLMKKIGRMRRHQSFLPSLDVLDASEVTNITVGRNLPSVLPNELGLMTGSEEEFRIFMEKYNNSELQQFKTQATTKSGEGPLIVCVDTSGSMGQIVHEDSPLYWAASVAAAAYITSLKKSRPFAVVYFNDIAQLYTPTKQGTFDTKFFTQILSASGGGGTYFEPAWRRVIEMMAKSGNNTWRKSDVLFITDGDGYIQSDWNKDKVKYSIRLFSFFIGLEQHGLKSELAMKLEGYSDMLSYLPELNNSAAEKINNVINKQKKQR